MIADFSLDNNGDLEISNGDFKIVDSAEQSVELLLITKVGEWKEFPQVGCNIQKALQGTIGRFLERNVRVQLEADGFEIEKLNITEKGIALKGDYE